MVDHPTSAIGIPEEDAPDAGLDEAQTRPARRGVKRGPPAPRECRIPRTPEPIHPDTPAPLADAQREADASQGRHPYAPEANQSVQLAAASRPSAIRPPARPFAGAPAYAREPDHQNHQASVALATPRIPREAGFTPDRRARFLHALSRDGSVAGAARAVGLTPQAAYALRAREPLFARLWAAALQLARPNLEDVLWSRAIDGVVEEVERDGPDGTTTRVVRRRFDNRLAMSLLTRLDRAAAEAGAARRDDAARRFAGHWDELLDAVEADGAKDAAAALLQPPAAPPPAPAPTPEDRDPFDALRAEDDGAVDIDDCLIAEDEDGRAWTDLPPAPGWAGETAAFEDIAFSPDLGLMLDDEERAPPFRTLDADEQAAWDARREARAALAAAVARATEGERLKARAAWLARTRALSARLLAAAAEAENGSAPGFAD